MKGKHCVLFILCYSRQLLHYLFGESFGFGSNALVACPPWQTALSSPSISTNSGFICNGHDCITFQSFPNVEGMFIILPQIVLVKESFHQQLFCDKSREQNQADVVIVAHNSTFCLQMTPLSKLWQHRVQRKWLFQFFPVFYKYLNTCIPLQEDGMLLLQRHIVYLWVGWYANIHTLLERYVE